MLHFQTSLLTGHTSVWGVRLLDTSEQDYQNDIEKLNGNHPWPLVNQTTGGIGIYRTETGQPLALNATGAYVLDTFITSYLFASGVYSFAQIVSITLAETLNISTVDAETTSYSVALAEVLNAADTGGAIASMQADLAETLNISEAYVFNGVYGVLLPESVLFADTAATNAALVSYVVNTATGAMSNYSNFNFNSFAQMGEKIYGMTDEGIYELTGADDHGTAIAASVKFGTSELGTDQVPPENMKRLPYAYLGVNTAGDMQLNVTANGATNSYVLTAATQTSMHVGRLKLGNGVASRYWDFELTNVAGSDFTLESITLLPEVLTRRVQES